MEANLSLDFVSILKASQIISGEIILSNVDCVNLIQIIKSALGIQLQNEEEQEPGFDGAPYEFANEEVAVPSEEFGEEARETRSVSLIGKKRILEGQQSLQGIPIPMLDAYKLAQAIRNSTVQRRDHSGGQNPGRQCMQGL